MVRIKIDFEKISSVKMYYFLHLLISINDNLLNIRP